MTWVMESSTERATDPTMSAHRPAKGAQALLAMPFIIVTASGSATRARARVRGTSVRPRGRPFW